MRKERLCFVVSTARLRMFHLFAKPRLEPRSPLLLLQFLNYSRNSRHTSSFIIDYFYVSPANPFLWLPPHPTMQRRTQDQVARGGNQPFAFGMHVNIHCCSPRNALEGRREMWEVVRQIKLSTFDLKKKKRRPCPPSETGEQSTSCLVRLGNNTQNQSNAAAAA